MSTRWYGPGQMIYQEGDPADAFYIVAEGSAEEIEPAKDSWGAAARPRVLRRAVVGEAVGSNALYAHLTETTADDLYPSSVRADGACTALCLTRDRFERAMEESPQMAEAIKLAISSASAALAPESLAANAWWGDGKLKKLVWTARLLKRRRAWFQKVKHVI